MKRGDNTTVIAAYIGFDLVVMHMRGRLEPLI